MTNRKKSTLNELDAELNRTRVENDKLRTLLAHSNSDCAFCGLPAAEMAKCASGFPGCSRADDMTACEHPTRQDLLDENNRLREDAARNRWCEENRADVKFSMVSSRWHVSWVVDGDFNTINHADRNVAIDAARKCSKYLTR